MALLLYFPTPVPTNSSNQELNDNYGLIIDDGTER